MSTSSRKCRSISHRTSSLLLQSLGVVGRSLARDLEAGRHNRIPFVTVNPAGYNDWKEFFNDYQASNLLRKYQDLNLGILRSKIALDGFHKSEVRCSSINHAFRMGGAIPNDILFPYLLRAQSIVKRILGDFSWDSALPFCDFGPGASIGVPRRFAHVCNKIGKINPTVTGPCSVLLEAYLRYDPHLREIGESFTISRGSRVVTVPKDARKDRLIAIEPLWNMFFQKGIGGLMRSRLKRFGLDLDRTQPINADLARKGSLDGSLATIDLSSASDTISHSLVEFLLPENWYSACMIVRSSHSELPCGEYMFLKKFSSMGNGFTFELESLIFLALCLAVNPKLSIGHDVSVFGDDIIIPVEDTPLLVQLLNLVGFTVNQEKSFTSGPFRESCGKHYFQGRDVTPIFFKEDSLNLTDKFVRANQIRKLAHRMMGGFGCDARFLPAWESVVTTIPARFRHLSAPYGSDDRGIHRNFDEVCPRPRVGRHGVEGYISRGLVRIPRGISHSGLPALISKLWYTRRDLPLGEESQYSLFDPQRYIVRSRECLYPQWPDYGPWW